MSKRYRPWKIDEPMLLPATVQEFVDKDHLARFVLHLVVEEVDLEAIELAYRVDRGQPPFDPAMMTALLLYGYCHGVYSSRRIAKACRERVDFMSIVGLDPPDFRTISEFRKRHLNALSALFSQVLRLCERAGLVKLGHVALDGTKIKANASKHKAMSYARMAERAAELETEVAGWMDAAAAADAGEDAAFGRDKSGDEMPDWVADKKRRAEKIRAAKAELEAEAKAAAEAERQARADAEKKREAEGRKKPGRPAAPPSEDPDPKAQKNPRARPGGRIMKTKDGFIQGYNAQAAVDAEAQVIVAYGLDAHSSDQHQLTPMVDGSKPTWAASRSRSRPTPVFARTPISRRWRAASSTPTSPPDAPSIRPTAKAEASAWRPCARRSGPAATTPRIACASIARAGVRADQAGPRLPPIPVARARRGRPRMGPRLPRPEHAQARPGEEPVRSHARNPCTPPTRPNHPNPGPDPPTPSKSPNTGHYLDRLLETARTQCLTKRRAHAIAGVGEDRPEANAGSFRNWTNRAGPRPTVRASCSRRPSVDRGSDRDWSGQPLLRRHASATISVCCSPRSRRPSALKMRALI